MQNVPWIYYLLVTIVYIAGVLCAVFALWRSRTPQGAAAWIVALVTFPLVTVPLFLLFGRNKFYGYVINRKKLDARAQKELEEARKLETATIVQGSHLSALNRIAPLCGQPGYSDGNLLHLLIDGKETYDDLLAHLENAKKYILFQFFILRDDKVGHRFLDVLCRKAKSGVAVYVLYDSVGTKLGTKFLDRLQQAGVRVEVFRGMRRWHSHMQVNFRNHRKLVVIDGQTVFTGGLNVGDDYLGEYPEIGPWRDAFVRIEGPAALSAQLSFTKDWYWACSRVPDLDWSPRVNEGGSAVLLLPTGPADDGSPCLMAHLALIESAKERIWIANPYFLPPESVMHALELAVLRGIDVRVIVPARNDNKYVAYASPVFLERALKARIRLFEFLPGFLHKKVILVDEAASIVGSVNLDSRSFFINFEIFAVAHEPRFLAAVESMLINDFSCSQELTRARFENQSFLLQLRSRAFALLSPML